MAGIADGDRFAIDRLFADWRNKSPNRARELIFSRCAHRRVSPHFPDYHLPSRCRRTIFFRKRSCATPRADAACTDGVMALAHRNERPVRERSPVGPHHMTAGKGADASIGAGRIAGTQGGSS